MSAGRAGPGQVQPGLGIAAKPPNGSSLFPSLRLRLNVPRSLPLPALPVIAAAPVAVGIGVAAHLHSASAARSLSSLGVAFALALGLRTLALEPRDEPGGVPNPSRPVTVRLPATAFTWLLVAGAIGVWLAASTDWWLLAVGAAGTVAAAGSARGTAARTFRGYGTLVSLAAAELLAGWGTVWVEVGRLPLLGLVAALLPASLATALLLLTDLRDQESDQASGRVTVAVRLGAIRARRGVLGLLGLALAVPLLITVPGLAGAECFLPWLVAPLAEGPMGHLSSSDGTRAGNAVRQMKLLLAAASTLLAIGIWTG